MVEVLRRYSRQSDIGKMCRNLRKLVDTELPERVEPAIAAARVHRVELRLAPEELAQLVLDYEAGWSSTELQARYRLGKGSVLRLLREAGVEMRRRPLAAEQMRAITKLYESGLTIREVAAELGLPKTTVQDELAQSGVTMRPAARRPRG